jgi:hypothetical protein
MNPNEPDQQPDAEPVVPVSVNTTASLTNTASATEPLVMQPNEPQPVPSTPVQPVTQPSALGSPKKSRKKLINIAVIAVVVLILLVGGVAAAYYSVVVPNKPENVLKTAMLNSLKENDHTVDMKVDVKPTAETPAMAFTAKISGASNSNEFTSEETVTMYGVTFPIEVRYVDEVLYAKIGDLKTIESLLSAYLGNMGADEQQLALLQQTIAGASDLLSNQWVSVDKTLLQTAEVDCVLGTSLALNDKDLQLLQDQYVKFPFATIKDTAKEKLGNADVIKYNLVLSGKQAEQYANSLDELSIVKNINKCSDTTDTQASDIEASAEDLLKDQDIAISVWVDQDTKRIVKMDTDISELSDQSDLKGKMSLGFTYEKVSITAPENAKPIMQLIGELQSVFAPMLAEFGL